MILIGWFSFKKCFLWGDLAVVALQSRQSGKLGAEDVYCWRDFVIGMRVVDMYLKFLNTINSVGIVPCCIRLGKHS